MILEAGSQRLPGYRTERSVLSAQTHPFRGGSHNGTRFTIQIISTRDHALNHSGQTFSDFSTLYGWTNRCDEQIAISCLQSNRFIKTVSAKIASDCDELDLLRSDPLDNFALLYTIVECSRGRDPHFSATSHTSSHKNVSHFTPAEIFYNTNFGVLTPLTGAFGS